MAAPAISVLMPVYNAEQYVAEAIESILTQTHADFEFIILNDGSTDRSSAIVRRYEQEDRRIQVVSRGNRGLVATLNEGIGLAKGEFLARMDADDLSAKNRLERQLSYMKLHEECVAVGSAILLADEMMLPIREFRYCPDHESIDSEHLQAHGGAQPHAPSLFRTWALRKIGGYREQFRHAEDVDLFLRLAEVGRLANLKEPLYIYRQHLASVSYRFADLQRRSTIEAAVAARRRRGLPPADELAIVPASGPGDATCAMVRWGWWALGAGHIPTARKYAWKALLRRPWSPAIWRLAACTVRGY